MKNDRQISLVEEISRQLNIDSIPWLLVTTLMQGYNKKQHMRQKKVQNEQFDEKKSTMKFHVAAKAHAKPDLRWDRGNGSLRTRCHPDKLPDC